MFGNRSVETEKRYGRVYSALLLHEPLTLIHPDNKTDWHCCESRARYSNYLKVSNIQLRFSGSLLGVSIPLPSGEGVQISLQSERLIFLFFSTWLSVFDSFTI